MVDFVGLFPALASVSCLMMVLGTSMMLRHLRAGAYVAIIGIVSSIILAITTFFIMLRVPP